MTLAQIQELRNKSLADATTLMAGATISAEQRSQFDLHMADVATHDADIVRVKAVEQFKSEQRSVDHPRPNPGESNDPAERSEVRDARVKASFRSYLSTGRVETRDLTVANSGVAIPTLFNPQVIEAQKSYGEVYELVTLMKTDHGNPIKLVLDNDTANGLTSVTVGTNASEVDPSISGATLQIDNFTTGVIRVDNGLLTDAGFDLEAFIRDKFGKRFFRGASSLIMAGDGGAVGSLATAYDSVGFTSAVTNKLGYIDFATAIGTLDPAYQMQAVWGMSNATLGYVIGLTDTAGRPLFLPNYGDASTGSVLSHLGLGKGPTLGTSSNPMFVRMAGAVGSVAGSIGGAVGSTAGKLGGVFGSMLKSFLPGFADGGYLNGPSLVGENGPEIFNPSGSGHVIPNHKLTGGGGGDIHFHPGAIDARGATDPAQVDAAVQRGIRAAAPHLMAGSVRAVGEQKMRRPSR